MLRKFKGLPFYSSCHHLEAQMRTRQKKAAVQIEPTLLLAYNSRIEIPWVLKVGTARVTLASFFSNYLQIYIQPHPLSASFDPAVW